MVEINKVREIHAGQNYRGILVRGVSYRLLREAYDHYVLSAGGRPVHVPKWITERCFEQEAREREREEQYDS